jgi:hypothetical protein
VNEELSSQSDLAGWFLVEINTNHHINLQHSIGILTRRKDNTQLSDKKGATVVRTEQNNRDSITALLDSFLDRSIEFLDRAVCDVVSALLMNCDEQLLLPMYTMHERTRVVQFYKWCLKYIRKSQTYGELAAQALAIRRE